MLEHAIKLHEQGFNIVFTKNPAKIGGKAPIGLWHKYIEEDQSIKDIKSMYKYALTKENDLGLAVICTKGIEVLDIDVKYFLEDKHFVSDVFDALMNSVGIDVFEKLVLAETISCGYHLIYRTNTIEGSQKLASRLTTDEEKKNEHDKVRVLLETRSHGGIFVVSPSGGYNYDNPNRTINEISLITDEQRDSLINTCRGFNEVDDVFRSAKTQPIDTKIQGVHKSTIQDFKEKNSSRSIIESIGWQYSHTRGSNEYFVRPGKSIREGISASIWTKEGADIFWNWSSSTELPVKVAMDSLALYAFLNTNGDVKEACRELYKNNYGDRLSKNQDSHKDKLKQIVSNDKTMIGKTDDTNLMDAIFNQRIDITVRSVEKPNSLFIMDIKKQKYVGLGGPGDVVNLFGGEKTRKTGAGLSIASCFLDGSKTSLMFKSESKNKNVIHFDTEQTRHYAQKVTTEMTIQAGLTLNKHPENLFSFPIKVLSKIDRLNFIKNSINRIPNIGCVFLDGIVDVCRNYNDLEEASDLITFFMNLAEKRQFLFLPLLHNARSTGSARGHLGTEQLNKGSANLGVTSEEDSQFSTLKVISKRGEWTDAKFDFWYNGNGNIEIYE